MAKIKYITIPKKDIKWYITIILIIGVVIGWAFGILLIISLI